MADKTLISWTDASWPVLSGCTRVSPACDNCYALRDGWRMGHNPNEKIRGAYEGMVEKGPDGKLDWSGKAPRLLEDRLNWPERWRKPRRIFVCNEGDLFHHLVPSWFINEVWMRIRNNSRHTFQILTKRPERLLAWTQGAARVKGWPVEEIWPEWCWLGVTAENQEMANKRIPVLLQVPGPVLKYVSVEPMLGALQLDLHWLGWVDVGYDHRQNRTLMAHHTAVQGFVPRPAQLGLVICGGESGANARPMAPDWARSLRDQCVEAKAPFFFKQWGEWAPATAEFGVGGSLMPETGEKVTWIGWDGRTQNPSWHGLQDPVMAIARVGKKRAGDLLDGVEWKQLPEARH